MALTEIQYAPHLASDRVMAQSPWVEQERIHLSPDHPDIGCECEDVVAGGESGDGTYPKGTISLPLHPNCLCWKEAVLMGEDEFVQRLRGWLYGTQAWPELDEYAGWVGMEPRTLESPWLLALEIGIQLWLWGSERELDNLLAVGTG